MPDEMQPIASRRLAWAAGSVAGGVSFVIAKMLIPASVSDISRHDLHLAKNIGFVFPAMLGLALGWVERSLLRMLLAMTTGSALGAIYAQLCGDRFEYVSAMLGFPCVIGGVYALLLGRDRRSWLGEAPWRFLKGLVAGFVCGFVYTISLNVVVIPILFTSSVPYENYSKLMWLMGPLALTLAGGVFLPLFCWSLGLQFAKPKPN